jgi:hypothetical protein
MTLQEYHRLMQVLAAELAAARSLGRDEGANAMEGVVQRLTEHMGKMYQEGQGLQNQCAQLKADFQAEVEKTQTSTGGKEDGRCLGIRLQSRSGQKVRQRKRRAEK